MRTGKKWAISFVCLFITILIAVGAFMVIVDPYFHYHKPLENIGYILDNERYQNNGIVKHFDYDAIITGSSMTECFKTSDLDALFGVNSIKVPFSGGSYKEVNDNLKVATEYNPNIKMVVRCLDAMRFFDDKDYLDYSDYPTYLYDDKLINDVSYLYNKQILLVALQNVIGFNKQGKIELSFDDYANWNNHYTFGIESINANYKRDTIVPAEEMIPITEEDYATIDANIEQNVIALAKEHPEIDFYIYISPYSIYCMDYWYQLGELERRLLAERHIIELLLPYENIHVFSFNTAYDTVCNPDNYRDVAHHSGAVNTQILQWMREGKYRLTYDNYEAYCEEEWNFYMNYDYDSLFE
ncbi:MAG: hypothetical protein E7291_04005 [Lachnospiraceae bacterium]|nr:hypothetical protein [Lachnospiraceae bacterium]